MLYTIALFGEAEKGEFSIPYFCTNLAQLADDLGHPPGQSRGLFYAIQALLYQRQLIFFRVREEGFSLSDYLRGISILKKATNAPLISALYLPGVGDAKILDPLSPICEQHHSILITNEEDFYDYLTLGVSSKLR